MTAHKKKLLQKITSKSAVIGILGMGYVGLPLMLRFADVGFDVVGFDIDQKKVDRILDGKSYIEHISEESIKKAVDSGMNATSDFSLISQLDAIILCVPTPLNKYREPDLSFVLNTLEAAVPFMQEGQVVSLESTTYPGTTEEELLPRIENGTGLKVGDKIFLIYSPEREDPGNKNYTTKTIPKIVGGETSNCLEVGNALYREAVDKVVSVSSTKAAEMTKLLENIHRAVNIGLVNEMKIVGERMGIDIHEVIEAAATKPFGFTPYYPGPGLGGHCIPIDPFYLTWKAREYGLNTRFIELSGEVNRKMPTYVVERLSDALNLNKKTINSSKVLILGIAYKKNVDDVRESPSVEIMEILKGRGAKIEYCDPHVFNLKSVMLTPKKIASYDAIILSTNHDQFDYDMIRKNAKLIIDSRGQYRGRYDNVEKA